MIGVHPAMVSCEYRFMIIGKRDSLMKGKIPRVDAMNLLKFTTERAPFLSQLLSSATSFLGSVIALACLHDSELKKWFLYFGTSMALQGVIRASLLETDLLLYGHVSKKNRILSLFCTLLPFSLLVIVQSVLDLQLTLLDLILVITSVLSLVQDMLRYEFIRNDRLGVVLADGIWFLISFIGLVLVITPIRDAPLTIYAILLLGPSFSSLHLLFRCKPLEYQSPSESSAGINSTRRYIILQNSWTLIITFVTNVILTKYLSGELFYQFRLIQTSVSPVQSFGLAVWFSKIVQYDKDLKEYSRIFRNSQKLIIFSTSFLLLFLFCTLTTKSLLILSFDVIWLITVLAAATGPILNIGFYEISLYLRSKQLFFETFIVGLLVLPLTPVLYFLLKSHLSLGAIFGIPLACMIIQQTIYLLIFRSSLSISSPTSQERV